MYRYAIYLFLCFTACFKAGAATESVRTYSHRYVDLTLSYVYCKEPLDRMLAYKGMAVILDNYAASLVEVGRLDGTKRIELFIGRGIHRSPSVEVWRNEHRYHVTLHHWPDLRRLMQVVEYCTSPHWESLVGPDEEKFEREYYNASSKLFDRRLARYAPQPDMTAAEDAVTVHRDDDFEIVYRNGRLDIYAGGRLVSGDSDGNPMNIGNIYPIKMRDRYIVFYENAIYVYGISRTVMHLEKTGETSLTENGDGPKPDILLIYEIPQKSYYAYYGHEHGYFTESYGDWMNVYHHRTDFPVFSYNYSLDRFYYYSLDEIWK